MVSSIIFKALNGAEIFLRPFISLLVFILSWFVTPIKKRLDFERLNLTFDSAVSFKKTSQKADLCFEVSSEGELEQVRPLIEKGLEEGLLIEIIYSSASVEKKVQALFGKFPAQLRVIRMPLLSAGPGRSYFFQSIAAWVSAPKLIFCRYDFFPELLRLRSRCSFVLISGATKNLGFYKKETFKLFDIVVAATSKEAKLFQELLGDSAEVFACDLRIPRIHQRTIESRETLKTHAYLDSFVSHIDSIKMDKKIILGSAWPSDLSILENPELIAEVKKKELTIVIAPHKLDDQSINQISKKLVELFGEDNLSIVSKESSDKFSAVMILRVSGILCELYNQFNLSYVGGGYERSIHSVFEPFFSDNIVFCGPKIHRSTEYDYIHANLPGEIHVLKNPESFYTILKQQDISKRDLNKRQELIRESYEVMESVNERVLSRKVNEKIK